MEPVSGTPRWVKIFGIVALVIVVLVGVVLVIGRGDHGPGRHGSGEHTGPPPGVTHPRS